MLLKKNIDANGDKSAIYRLSDASFGKQLMTQQPDIKIATIVSTCVDTEFESSRQFRSTSSS